MFNKANLWRAVFVVIGAAIGVAFAGYQSGKATTTTQTPSTSTAEPAS